MNSSKSSSSEWPLPVMRHRVTEAEAGQRVDRLLGDRPGVASREMARRLIGQGNALVNEAACEPDTRVQSGDVVAYCIPAARAATGVRAEPGPLNILHEDGSLLVVNKAPGVPMHPGPGHPGGTLVNFLLHHCRDLSGVGGEKRPGIVHRLDKDTSGVVVVAKNDEAHIGLQEQFRDHDIERTYFAITVGVPTQAAGTIEAPLQRERHNRMRRGVSERGKDAVTHWRVEARLDPFALLRLNLETGRTHQIRVHLAHGGWPVLGDPLYGKARHRGLRLPEPLMEMLDAFRRQALHAAVLGFHHPISGEWMRFTAGLPDDMAEVLRAITIYQTGIDEPPELALG